MSLYNFSYLFSIILFCAPVALIVWKLQGRVLKKYELAILVTIIVSLPIVVAEHYALKWKAWEFNPDAVINFRIGGQIESFIFLSSVIIAYGSIVLLLAELVDHRGRKKKKLKTRTNRKH